jgi:hypothetical protein
VFDVFISLSSPLINPLTDIYALQAINYHQQNFALIPDAHLTLSKESASLSQNSVGILIKMNMRIRNRMKK